MWGSSVIPFWQFVSIQIIRIPSIDHQVLVSNSWRHEVFTLPLKLGLNMMILIFHGKCLKGVEKMKSRFSGKQLHSSNYLRLFWFSSWYYWSWSSISPCYFASVDNTWSQKSWLEPSTNPDHDSFPVFVFLYLVFDLNLIPDPFILTVFHPGFVPDLSSWCRLCTWS